MTTAPTNRCWRMGSLTSLGHFERSLDRSEQIVNIDAGVVQMKIAEIIGAHQTVPFALSKVMAGFPSPAEDYLDRPLDFNELLLVHPDATFAVRIAGDSMVGAGLFPGDIAIVDRAVKARDRAVVLAVLDGEFTIKRYRARGERRWLEAENPAYADIELSEERAFEVWGVVNRSIRMLG